VEESKGDEPAPAELNSNKRKAEDEVEEIENADTPIPPELEKVDDDDYEYYEIPNYTNKYDTEEMLAIGRSKIMDAGLGLFAYMPKRLMNDPDYKEGWVQKKGWDKPKFLLFKGYPRDLKKHTTYIDEYKGEHIKTKTPDELDAILESSGTDKAIHITKTYAIDGNSPTSCYAAYANDPKKGSGLTFNAAFISDVKSKTAAIIAIKDIYVHDEIYVDYGSEYWNTKKQTVANTKKKEKPSRKKQKQISGEDYANV